jgi:hypothetical protein
MIDMTIDHGLDAWRLLASKMLELDGRHCAWIIY